MMELSKFIEEVEAKLMKSIDTLESSLKIVAKETQTCDEIVKNSNLIQETGLAEIRKSFAAVIASLEARQQELETSFIKEVGAGIRMAQDRVDQSQLILSLPEQSYLYFQPHLSFVLVAR